MVGRCSILVALLLVCLQGTFAVDWDWDTESPLDEYVFREDDTFAWEEIAYYDYSHRGCQMHVLNFTSQTWLTTEWSSQPVWFHYVVVAIPDDFVYQDAGAMYITGSSIHSNPPHPGDTNFNATCQFAVDTGAVGILLKMIPNQPIRFPNDPEQRNRTEDAIIAWTWRMFINDTESPGPDVLLQFPMTKAAVRALDVVTEFVPTQVPSADVQRYMVTGGSKRGWIAWLVSAVDKRVFASMPIVLSCLNSIDNFYHHYQSLGGWSWVLKDYHDVEIFAYLEHPNTQLLMDYVDPWSYRSRLTMPKLIMSATGDEFFLPDDSHYFFDDLPEPKYMMMLENTNHGLSGQYDRAYFGGATFFLTVIDEVTLPEFTWDFYDSEDGGWVRAYTNVEPLMIRGVYADTVDPVRRDYRWTTGEGRQEIEWHGAPVEDEGDNTYFFDCGSHENSTQWRACFIDVRFEGHTERLLFNLDFTTEVNFIPDVMPFPKCEGWECQNAGLV